MAASWSIVYAKHRYGLGTCRPDNCDGTFSSNCDSSRDYTGISSILKNAGMTSLLNDMNTYWKNQPTFGTDEELWEHEWATHGTCINTFDTKCYTNYKLHDELLDFLQVTVDLFKTNPTYDVRPLPFLST